MTRPSPKLSLPSFKSLGGGLLAAAPLGFALVAALVGHGLLLAHGPWRRSPAKAQVLTAVDTTPELLHFSRRMPQEVAATTIPLPPATTLPPPPPELLSPLPTKEAKEDIPAKTPKATPGKGGAQDPKASSPRPHGAKAHLIPGQAAKGPGAKSDTKGPKGAPASGPPAKGAGGPALALGPLRLSPSPPAEALQRWRELRTSGEAEPPAPGSSGSTSEPLKAAAAAPYLRLWDKAVPAAITAGTDRALSEGIQARRLPLAAARALGLDPGQQQWIKAADQSLLVWSDGPNLWLLKGPSTAESPGR